MGKVGGWGVAGRAGKVRNQTPKVSPAEDSGASSVGRSKKRRNYNRRFLTPTDEENLTGVAALADGILPQNAKITRSRHGSEY